MNPQLRPNFRIAERRLPFECVALVLQGGGALGAYQGGVYEALAEANIHPNWIAGVSIGRDQRCNHCRQSTQFPRRPPARVLERLVDFDRLNAGITRLP